MIIVENLKHDTIAPTDDELVQELKLLLKTETKNNAIKLIKDKYNLTKSYVYNLYEKNKD